VKRDGLKKTKGKKKGLSGGAETVTRKEWGSLEGPTKEIKKGIFLRSKLCDRGKHGGGVKGGGVESGVRDLKHLLLKKEICNEVRHLTSGGKP